MAQNDSGYEFYVGPATHLEGASLAIDGTARIDGKIVGKVAVKHLIVGPTGCVVGDISGETAEIEGTVEDSLQLIVGIDLRAHLRILKVVLLDIHPELFGQLRARKGFGTNHSGESVVRCDRFHECCIGFTCGFFSHNNFVG